LSAGPTRAVKFVTISVEAVIIFSRARSRKDFRNKSVAVARGLPLC